MVMMMKNQRPQSQPKTGLLDLLKLFFSTLAGAGAIVYLIGFLATIAFTDKQQIYGVTFSNQYYVQSGGRVLYRICISFARALAQLARGHFIFILLAAVVILLLLLVGIIERRGYFRGRFRRIPFLSKIDQGIISFFTRQYYYILLLVLVLGVTMQLVYPGISKMDQEKFFYLLFIPTFLILSLSLLFHSRDLVSFTRWRRMAYHIFLALFIIQFIAFPVHYGTYFYKEMLNLPRIEVRLLGKYKNLQHTIPTSAILLTKDRYEYVLYSEKDKRIIPVKKEMVASVAIYTGEIWKGLK